MPGLSGSEDQRKMWDGFEIKPCPTKRSGWVIFTFIGTDQGL